MKALLFRATAPAVTLASCLVMFGGVANAQSASITDSGRDSSNSIEFKNICILKVNNDTNISVTNESSQSATTGNANVRNNDDVGNVTTGNASNSNSSNFNLSVSNTTGSCLPQQTGQQGGQGGGEVTPPAVTPTASAVTPAGGQGGGAVATLPAAQQVAVVPTGGVGAGEGTPAYLAGLTAVTLGSGAFAFRRLQKSYKNQF